MRLARDKVFHAICRRRMHDPRAAFRRHIVAEKHRRRTFVARMRRAQRMVKTQAAQLLARRGRDGRAGHAVLLQAFFDAFFRQDQQTLFGIDEAVDDLRMHVQRLVGGNRPRRRGPDHDAAFRLIATLRQFGESESLRGFFRLGEGEHHVDSRIRLVLVFHFRFGQRRAAIETPVHRLQPAIHITLLDDLPQRTDFARFVDEVHGLVRVVPVAENAQPAKTQLLLFDLLARIFAGLFHHFARRQGLAELLLDLDFDRHAMAIPAWHINRVEARQVARLHDHVLQDLVHRVAKMDVAIRIRRAVMQDELLAALAGGADLLVDLVVLPFLHPLRLALGKSPRMGNGVSSRLTGYFDWGLASFLLLMNDSIWIR